MKLSYFWARPNEITHPKSESLYSKWRKEHFSLHETVEKPQVPSSEFRNWIWDLQTTTFAITASKVLVTGPPLSISIANSITSRPGRKVSFYDILGRAKLVSIKKVSGPKNWIQVMEGKIPGGWRKSGKKWIISMWHYTNEFWQFSSYQSFNFLMIRFKIMCGTNIKCVRFQIIG